MLVQSICVNKHQWIKAKFEYKIDGFIFCVDIFKYVEKLDL